MILECDEIRLICRPKAKGEGHGHSPPDPRPLVWHHAGMDQTQTHAKEPSAADAQAGHPLFPLSPSAVREWLARDQAAQGAS